MQHVNAAPDALPRLTGAAFTAVKGVFLIGNPDHKSGLACNVDNRGGTTTRNVNGLSATLSAGIPSNWVSKTLDVCIYVSSESRFMSLELVWLLTMEGWMSGRRRLRHHPRLRHQRPAPAVPARHADADLGDELHRRSAARELGDLRDPFPSVEAELRSDLCFVDEFGQEKRQKCDTLRSIFQRSWLYSTTYASQ